MANMASSIPAYMPAYGPLSCIYVPLQCGGSTEEESLGSGAAPGGTIWCTMAGEAE